MLGILWGMGGGLVQNDSNVTANSTENSRMTLFRIFTKRKLLICINKKFIHKNTLVPFYESSISILELSEARTSLFSYVQKPFKSINMLTTVSP